MDLRHFAGFVRAVLWSGSTQYETIKELLRRRTLKSSPPELPVVISSRLTIKVYTDEISATFFFGESDQPLRLLRLVCELEVHVSVS